MINQKKCSMNDLQEICCNMKVSDETQKFKMSKQEEAVMLMHLSVKSHAINDSKNTILFSTFFYRYV